MASVTLATVIGAKFPWLGGRTHRIDSPQAQHAGGEFKAYTMQLGLSLILAASEHIDVHNIVHAIVYDAAHTVIHPVVSLSIRHPAADTRACPSLGSLRLLVVCMRGQHTVKFTASNAICTRTAAAAPSRRRCT